jgi:Flp pilus assembly pilin Flp
MLNALAHYQKVACEFLKDEDGLSATEYVVLFIVVLAFIVAGAQLLGPEIQAAFERAAATLP